MKQKIHPEYYTNAQITCSSCGTVYIVGDTKESTLIELCSACHPFYTGKQTIVDTANRVKRFENLQKESSKLQENAKNKKTKTEKTQGIQADKPLTLKDMLKAVQQENE